MGFFDFLKHTVPDIINVLTKNAGNIANVVAAVAGAASGGLRAGSEETLEAVMTNTYPASGENVLPHLHSLLETAETKMKEAADEHSPQPKCETNNTLRPIEITGCWPNPALVTGGNAPPEIGAEVNKVLSLHGMPTSLGTGNSAIDVGAQLAQQMFSGAPQSLSVAGNISVLQSTGDINIDAWKSHGIRITGKHIYYPIPMNQLDSNDVAWHSHTKLWVEESPQHREHMVQRMRNLRIRPAATSRIMAEGSSYNMTTVAAKWNGSTNVDEIMTNAVNDMTHGSYFEFVAPPVISGTVFRYNFRTPTNIGPAAVKTALSNAIAERTKQTLEGNMILPIQPEVSIDSSHTVIG